MPLIEFRKRPITPGAPPALRKVTTHQLDLRNQNCNGNLGPLLGGPFPHPSDWPSSGTPGPQESEGNFSAEAPHVSHMNPQHRKRLQQTGHLEIPGIHRVEPKFPDQVDDLLHSGG